jgi:glycosyltransferase involved in cell wall biosynthesis
MREVRWDGSLRYVGLGDATGYGIAAAALAQALRAAGVDLVWEPMLPGDRLGLGYAPAPERETGPPELRHLRDDRRACDDVIIHFVPEYYPYFIARERANGARRILGHTVWETDRLPAHWPKLINQLDGVIVPTEWNRDVFRNSGVDVPIIIAPHLPQFAAAPVPAADRAHLAARLPDLSGRHVFYTISTWLERKGIAPLIAAFVAAFDAEDRVALVIKTTPHDLERHGPDGFLPVRPQVAEIVARAAAESGRAPPPIHVLTDELPPGELRALHEIGDCFVSLTRAEGWGLGAFEAAWLAKPVIVTGWGGPTAFLSADTAYFVAWSLAPVQPARPNASYTPDQNWAEPDLASAIAALRAVMADPAEAARRGAAASTDVRQHFTPEKMVPDLLAQIARLPPRLRSRGVLAEMWRRTKRAWPR